MKWRRCGMVRQVIGKNLILFMVWKLSPFLMKKNNVLRGISLLPIHTILSMFPFPGPSYINCCGFRQRWILIWVSFASMNFDPDLMQLMCFWRICWHLWIAVWNLCPIYPVTPPFITLLAGNGCWQIVVFFVFPVKLYLHKKNRYFW